MFYVYALKSLKNNDLYIGYSADLRSRFLTHNNGKVRSTKPNRPWRLVYYEAYLSKEDARKRESQLKKSCYKENLFSRLTCSLK
ncbi:GIY-YIG nuclease family protein [Patescibacteria group bacterium]|nr:GIY-YIG nuclease family protein [Patescibacteria group bacterium]